MATKAWVAKQKRREALVKKFADIRRELKKQKNYAAIANLPRDSSPTRSHNRCQLTGRSKGVLRKLKYGMNGDKVIHEIDRASKPGCRVYRSVKELPTVLNGMGIVVVSTSKGVMSDRRARENNVGGEVLCTVS